MALNLHTGGSYYVYLVRVLTDMCVVCTTEGMVNNLRGYLCSRCLLLQEA
jgi:hypothetical protein